MCRVSRWKQIHVPVRLPSFVARLVAVHHRNRFVDSCLHLEQLPEGEVRRHRRRLSLQDARRHVVDAGRAVGLRLCLIVVAIASPSHAPHTQVRDTSSDDTLIRQLKRSAGAAPPAQWAGSMSEQNSRVVGQFERRPLKNMPSMTSAAPKHIPVPINWITSTERSWSKPGPLVTL